MPDSKSPMWEREFCENSPLTAIVEKEVPDTPYPQSTQVEISVENKRDNIKDKINIDNLDSRTPGYDTPEYDEKISKVLSSNNNISFDSIRNTGRGASMTAKLKTIIGNVRLFLLRKK